MHVRRDRDSYLVLTVSAFHLNDAPELHRRASRLAIAATTPLARTHFPRRKARVQARPQHAVERQKIGGLRGCHILVLHEASTDSMLMVVQHTGIAMQQPSPRPQRRRSSTHALQMGIAHKIRIPEEPVERAIRRVTTPKSLTRKLQSLVGNACMIEHVSPRYRAGLDRKRSVI